MEAGPNALDWNSLMSVLIGATIALVASWGGEWLRYRFTRKQELEDQHRTFQRETMLKARDFLADTLRTSMSLVRVRKVENRWDATVESEADAELADLLLQVRVIQGLIEDETIRKTIDSGIKAGANLYSAKSKAESEAQLSILLQTFNAAIDRIGDLLRDSRSGSERSISSAPIRSRRDGDAVEQISKESGPPPRSLL